MSISPGSIMQQPPEPEPTQRFMPSVSAPAPRNWFQPVVIIVLVVLAVANFIVFYDLNGTRKDLEQQIAELKEGNGTLAKKLDASDERQNALKGEVLMTREKLGTTARDLDRARSLAKQLGDEQKAAEAKLTQQIGGVGQQVTSLRDEASQKLTAVNTEVAGAKTDIAATRKDLEATKVQLTTAIGDITNAKTLIARNHDELLELRRRGERNYIEFDLPKEKQPRRVGDVSLQLKGADPKKQKYSILLIAEDARNEKKDKTVNEPVQFYMGRTHVLYEIVVNKVTKDRITGYLATPK